MTKMILGVDPDTDRHGVALYIDSILEDLFMLNTIELLDKIKALGDVSLSIENVKVNQFVYARNQQSSKAAQSKIAMYVGRNQQAQIELERWLVHLDIPYVLHSPQKGNWAKNKERFEQVTGWTGKSNADTRSASYFGYLAL